MGLFLSLSGVIDAGLDEVKKALSSFAQNQNGGFELAEGSTDEPNIGAITHSGSNTTVSYPDGFFEWDAVSKDISEKLGRIVFARKGYPCLNHARPLTLAFYLLLHRST